MLEFRSLTCKMSYDAALFNALDMYSGKMFVLAVSCRFYENLCKLAQVDSKVLAETFDDSEAIDIYEDETRTKKIARMFFYELNGIYFLKEVSSELCSYKKSYNCENDDCANLMIYMDV